MVTNRLRLAHLVAKLMLLCSSREAWGHRDPFVVLAMKLQDRAGAPLDGFFAEVHGPAAYGIAPVEQGVARVEVGFRKDFSGELILQILDKRRSPVPFFRSPGVRLESRLVRFTHKGRHHHAGDASKQDKAVEFVSSDCRLVSSLQRATPFVIDWDPARITKEARDELEAHRKIDERNAQALREQAVSVPQ